MGDIKEKFYDSAEVIKEIIEENRVTAIIVGVTAAVVATGITIFALKKRNSKAVDLCDCNCESGCSLCGERCRRCEDDDFDEK